MRNEAIQRFDVLVGSWRSTMKNAWFLPEGTEVPGTATGSWLGESFVVFHWEMPGETGGAANALTLVIGRSDVGSAFTTLYHDQRGVCRVFPTTFDGTTWDMFRTDSDMHQRLIATVEPDKIVGRADASDDHGATWRTDFDFVLERITT